MTFWRRSAPLLLLTASVVLVPPLASAQDTTPQPRKQVISANPFGMLLGLFNAEFERKVSDSATMGIGGSSYTGGDDDYVNADLFYRYYPSGKPLEGWSFGVKAGATNLSDSSTYFGLGFDANWSWLLGKKHNFYVGLGFGLKRLFGVDESSDDTEFIPTARIVNIGFAF